MFHDALVPFAERWIINMKKTYTVPEIEITKFQEEVILMSGVENEAESPWGDEDLG